MRWTLCVSDGKNGYTVHVCTNGDNYPRTDCNLMYKAELDDGTPCMVNKQYVVIMFPDEEVDE